MQTGCILHRCFGKMDNCSMSGMLGFGDLRHFEDYIGSQHYLIDPVFRQVKKSWLPVPWHATDYVDQENPWSKMFRLTLEAGYERGISLPTGPFGNRFAMVAFYGAAPASFGQKYRQTLRRASHRLPSGKREASLAAQSVSPPDAQLSRTRVPVVGEERQNRM